MAALFFRSNDAGGGQRYFRSNDASGSASGTGLGATATATAPTGSALGYAQVTMAAPFNTGPNSIYYPPNFSGTPADGDIVKYPQKDNFRILPDGTIQCDVNSGSYPCFYNDGGGDDAFTVVLVPSAFAIGGGAEASAEAPAGAAFGGISGLGVTVTATAPTGVGQVVSPGAASGLGVTATASAPTGTPNAGGQGIGEGATALATPPDVAPADDGGGVYDGPLGGTLPSNLSRRLGRRVSR